MLQPVDNGVFSKYIEWCRRRCGHTFMMKEKEKEQRTVMYEIRNHIAKFISQLFMSQFAASTLYDY